MNVKVIEVLSNVLQVDAGKVTVCEVLERLGRVWSSL